MANPKCSWCVLFGLVLIPEQAERETVQQPCVLGSLRTTVLEGTPELPGFESPGSIVGAGRCLRWGPQPLNLLFHLEIEVRKLTWLVQDRCTVAAQEMSSPPAPNCQRHLASP